MSQDELSPKKFLAAHAIAQGESRLEACTIAKCSIATLKRWLKEPLFLAEIKQFQQGIFDEALSIAVAKSVDAINSLASIAASSPNESARVAAAKAVLEVGSKNLIHRDVLQHLAELEEQIRDGK
jgi:hypothetical protein